jgi:hypothetical protein
LLPGRLADWAARAAPVRGAQAMVFAVAIATLFSAPLRISNLAGLHLDRHLLRPGGPRSLILIEIPPEEVKNAVRLLYELPRRVTSLVDRFIRDFRPTLAMPDNCFLSGRITKIQRHSRGRSDTSSRSGSVSTCRRTSFATWQGC